MSPVTSTLSDQELLARLVAFDSARPHGNLAIADFVCEYLDRPGIRIARQPAPEGDDVNLVIAAGPEVEPGTRPGLTLCGHLDVVPAGEPGWTSDPFELTDTGDALVGRGSADMKGFVALAIQAIAGAAGGGLRRPLGLLLTWGEEIGTLGARHYVDHPPDIPLPRRMIVGEPTSLEVVRMHKGFTKLRVVVEGQSAHSGYPHLGRSAIEPAARVVSALAGLRRELEGELCPNREHFAEVPFVALNVGTIHGGTAVNVIPERCDLGISFRVLPGMDAAPVTDRVRAAVADALADGTGHRVEIVDDAPPLLLAEDNDLYRGLTDLLGQDRTASASYATDGGWLQQAGFDCLLWGPGSIEVAHRPNEAMPKDEFRRGGDLLKQAIARFCG